MDAVTRDGTEKDLSQRRYDQINIRYVRMDMKNFACAYGNTLHAHDFAAHAYKMRVCVEFLLAT